jgi:hypothetical protein
MCVCEKVKTTVKTTVRVAVAVAVTVIETVSERVGIHLHLLCVCALVLQNASHARAC